MNTTIDFTKLKRIPTSVDIEKAQTELENILPNIIEKHENFFSENKGTEKIDYIINHSTTSKSGFIQIPYPEILFMNSGLDEKIRQDVALKFYEFLFTIINKHETSER